MENFSRKNYIAGLLPIVFIIWALGMIILNSFNWYGHAIIRYDHFKSDTLVSCVGYETTDLGQLGSKYKVSDEANHYITAEISWGTPEVTFLFGEPAIKDTNVHIWYCSSDGGILVEEDYVWKEGEQFIRLDVPHSATGLVSLQIDGEFQLFEVLDTYERNRVILKIKIYIAFTLGMIILTSILSWLMPFKKLVKKLNDKEISIKNKLSDFFRGTSDEQKQKRRILCINILIFLASVVIGSVLVIILSNVGTQMFGNELRANYKTITTAIAVIWTILLLITNRKRLAENLAFYGMLLMLIAGTAFTIVIPPSMGVCWDDEIHYRNASNLAHIIDKEAPSGEDNLHFLFTEVAINNATYDEESAKTYASIYKILDEENYFRSIGHTFEIVDLVYLPLALGILIARGLKLGFITRVMLGRWFNLLFFAIISYFCMKRLNRGKLVVFLFATIPTNFLLATNYAYDTWLTALMMLGTVYILAEFEKRDEEMSRVSFWLIPIAMFLANLYKKIYFIMLIPALFMPSKKFKSKAKAWIYRLVILVATGLPFVLVMLSHVVNAGSGDSRGGSGVNAASQIDFIKNNIGYFLQVLYKFLKTYLNPFAISKSINSYVDHFAYLKHNGILGIGLQILLIVIIGSVLSNRDEKWNSIPIWYRLGYIVVYIGVGVLCATAFYVSFTPVGADWIGGCQGRYLLPAVFPVLYCLTKVSRRVKVIDKIGDENINMVFMAIMMMINYYALFANVAMAY